MHNTYISSCRPIDVAILSMHVPALTLPGLVISLIVDPGGPVVIIFASGSEIRGFDPGRHRWIFQSVKILIVTSFGREVKPWVPSRRFTAHKRTSSQN